MGRRRWIAWGSAFAVSGVLWLVTHPWLDEEEPVRQDGSRAYVCASGSADPVCAHLAERSSKGP